MSNFKIEYIYEIIDKFTPVAQKIKAQTKEISSTMVAASQLTKEYYKTHYEGMDKISKKMEQVGRKMSLFVTAPIVAMGVLAIKEFADSEQGIKRLETSLKNTHGIIGLTSKELIKEAKAFQQYTIYSDDQVLSQVTNTLTRFESFRGNMFKRAQKTILDVAAAKDIQDLSGLTSALGKTVQSGMLKSLKDLGIDTISKATEKQITLMASQARGMKAQVRLLETTGQLEKAKLKDKEAQIIFEKIQSKILDELDRKYAGQARALGETSKGQFTILKNVALDSLKGFGDLLSYGLIPVIRGLRNLFTWIDDLSPVSKGFAIALLGIVAAIGPLIWGMAGLIKTYIAYKEAIIFIQLTGWFQWLTKLNMMTKIATAVQWAWNASLYGCPIVWIIAGVIALGVGIYFLWKKWAVVKQAFMETTWAKVLISYLTYVYNLIKNIWSFISNIYNKVAGIIGNTLANTNEINGKVTQHVTGVVNQSLHTSNKSDVNITLNAPKGTVKQVTTKTNGAGLRLGYNMGGQ